MLPETILQRTRMLFSRALPAMAALAVMVATSSSFWAISEKGTAPKPAEELPPGAMQAKATASCLECHEARIILQQRLSKGAWLKEDDKMIKWGAVVEANDHDALVDYLGTNFGPDQAPYDPPRTSGQSIKTGK